MEITELFKRHCKYVSDGYIQGKLYEVDRYPGAVTSDDIRNKVSGELYKIVNSDYVLPRLDEYEECSDKFPEPHEFIRKKLPVKLAGGIEVVAWVYVFNHDVSKLIQIVSGDYSGHINVST